MASQEGQDGLSLISGKYEVLSLAGRGGTGVVYKVRHVALDTIFALKVLSTEFCDNTEIVNRFHQEARVMARFRHPNIVQVSDVDKDENTPYFVMEYVEGQSLSEYLTEHGPLSVQAALVLGRQVALALDYAHTHASPVIHRDIKPQNILIETHSERAVVTDFGIAKVRGASTQTSTDLMLGTLLYCAPEQILPGIEIDGRADLYSLGLVLYEMVAHRPFFADLDERTLLGKMLYGPEDNIPVFTTQVLPEFFFLVRRAISRKPEDRYQSAKELLQDIDACLALLSPSCDSRVPIQPNAAASTGTVHLQRETLVPSEEPPRALIRKAIVGPRRPLALAGAALLLGVIGGSLFLPSGQTSPASNPVQRESPEIAVPLPTALPPVHSDMGKGVAAQTQATAVSESTPNVTMPEEEPSEKIAEGSPVSPQAAAVLESTPSSNDQSFSSPRRFRVTTLTAVRENPTWESREITWLKPGARVYAVARIGEWLKIESRARPPKPPGFVWQADTRRE